MGSKNRHAKEMLPIILKDRKPEQWYVEPFVGGFNMIDKVDGNRIANDINHYLIDFARKLQEGWLPPEEISENDYKDIKDNKDSYDNYLLGYVGFQLSYGAKWFGGYRRDKTSDRNYSLEAFNNVKKQAPLLKDMVIDCGEYHDLSIPDNSIIYCDPPYANTTKYKDDFDHDMFWCWVRDMSEQGHKVFVSEYNAPDDFKCVWEKTVNNTLTKQTGSKQGVERLFVL